MHLDMALARGDPQGWLRPEIDELAPEVALVLRNPLVQRRRQPRIIPRGGLRIVIDKVNPGRVGQAHFPPAGERTELRHGLLLDGRVVATVGVLSVPSDVLLSTRIDPRRRSGIVVDKVRSAFRSKTLFPPGRQFPRSRCSSRRGHHGDGVGIGTTTTGCLRV